MSIPRQQMEDRPGWYNVGVFVVYLVVYQLPCVLPIQATTGRQTRVVQCGCVCCVFSGVPAPLCVANLGYNWKTDQDGTMWVCLLCIQ